MSPWSAFFCKEKIMSDHPLSNNPCVSCGACCATFRVSFYWAEADALGIAPELTEQVNAFYGCMAGTNQPQPRCQALCGDVGGETRCQIYHQRPAPCHELQAGEAKCNQARLRHGLSPIPTHPLTHPPGANDDAHFDHAS